MSSAFRSLSSAMIYHDESIAPAIVALSQDASNACSSTERLVEDSVMLSLSMWPSSRICSMKRNKGAYDMPNCDVLIWIVPKCYG